MERACTEDQEQSSLVYHIFMEIGARQLLAAATDVCCLISKTFKANIGRTRRCDSCRLINLGKAASCCCCGGLLVPVWLLRAGQECDKARGAGAYLVFIDIGVEQLLVAAVDDCWAVTGSKDMGHAIAGEGLQADGLAAQAQLLSIT